MATCRLHSALRLAIAPQCGPIQPPQKPAAWLLIYCLLAISPLLQSSALAQTSAEKQASANPSDPASPKKAAEVAEATKSTLKSLINTRSNSEKELKGLKNRGSDEPDEKSQVEKLRDGITDTEEQITALATGISEKEYQAVSNQELNLQSELQQLAIPFVMMLRSATENARQIDILRRQQAIATKQKTLATAATNNICSRLRAITKTPLPNNTNSAVSPAGKQTQEELCTPLEEASQATNQGSAEKEKLVKLLAAAGTPKEKSDRAVTDEDRAVITQLIKIYAQWRERLRAADDLLSSTDSLLTEKLSSRSNLGDATGLPSFFVGRGTNLLMAAGVFLAVLLAFQLIRILFNRTIGRSSIRGVARRLIALTYGIVAVVSSAVAALTVFNLRNDWVLLGAALLAMLATAWFIIKSLPDLIQQAILYLNVGAVQEGERLMFNGIPWLVERLSFQSQLVNPALSCASFTVPIGELKGLHSRPTKEHEAWFPSNEGDWVLLEEGQGQVMSQTPSHVEIRLLGGARKSFAANEYFAAPPINLSYGARAEIVFRISHRHLLDATTEIPDSLREFVTDGLREVLPAGQLIAVDVEMLEVTDSAILYEVEADISAMAASQYETVERLLTRLCVEACNRYGWEIPFQQITVHNGSV